MIRQTTALRKIRQMRKRVRVIQGGQGASKTYSIVTILINYAIAHPGLTITIFQFELSKAKKTVVRDFLAIMKKLGIFERDRWVGGVMYQFDNGSYIEFSGLDTVDLGKGFRRDIAYFNEANRGIKWEAYVQVESRCRIVYIDFNPDAEFWVHKEVLKEAESEFLCLTFHDNEYLSPVERARIIGYREKGYIDPDREDYDEPDNVRSKYWANKWRVYGMGLTGVIEGQIYTWEEVNAMPALDTCDWEVYGLDFGFTYDPTALIRVRKKGMGLYFEEIIYETGLSNRDILARIKAAGIPSGALFYCDSAAPKDIGDLRHGFKAEQLPGIRAVEGLKPILSGINKLHEYDCHFLRTSSHIRTEMQNYRWVMMDDKSTNEPIDDYNHAMDAIRYAVYTHTLRVRK